MIRQLLKFFLVYSTTLVAFGLVLFVLMARDEELFDNPWTSSLKVTPYSNILPLKQVLMMMIGEFDFADTFTVEQIKKSQVVEYEGLGVTFPVIIQLIMILLMFLITIIIGNLITGLTVHNLR